MLSPVFRPPRGAAGAAGVRAHAIATGLCAAGYPVTVVCARSAGNERRVEAGVEVIPTSYLDVEAQARRVGLELRDLPRSREPGGEARNSAVREIVARMTIPERYVIWIPGAVAAARRHGRWHDTLLSSGPHSAHLAARMVLGGRPWLADINDLYALNPHRTNGRLRDAIDVFVERRTLAAATTLTAANEAMGDEMRRRMGRQVTTVDSGFHPEEFEYGRPRRERDQSVKLIYAGSLYPSQNLEPLFGALAHSRREGELSAVDLEVSFLGPVTERAKLEAERFGVGDLVIASEPIAREELLESMRAADALILPLYDSDSAAVPLKLFEYIGAGRPIIAWGKLDSVTARLILDNGFGVVATSDRELGYHLGRVIAHDASLPSGDDRTRARFTWRHSVETMTELIARMT